MDVAALQLSVDSEPVRRAANDLDAFSAAAKRAGAATGNPNGSIAKLVATVQSLDAKLSVIIGTLNKISGSMGAAANAANQAAAANNNAANAATRAGASFRQADAHVIAYRNHLQAMAAASMQAATAQTATATAVSRTALATQSANAHVIAYRNHLLSLAAANTTAATATGRAAAATVGATAASRAASSTLAALGGAIGGVVGMIVGSLLGAIMQWVASLWDADKATKAVTAASDGMADAQSALGKIFDTTTGKIQNQNEMLRLNARLLAANLRAEALAAKTQAASAINEAGERSWRSIWMDNVPGSRWGESRNTLAKQKLQGVLDGTLNSEAVQQWAERADFSGVSISRQGFMEAVARALEVRLKRETADEISKSLNSGELSPVFRQEGSATGRAVGAASRATRASKTSDNAQEKAADQYILSLTDEIAKIGLAGEALRKYEVDQAAAKAATDAQRIAIKELGAERERALKVFRQQQELETAQKALDDARKSMVGGIDIELQTMHLLGAEREREILRIQRHLEMTDLLAKIKAAEADGNVALADTYRQLAETIDEKYAKNLQLITGREAIDQYTKAMDEARYATKSFASDWLSSVQQSGNAFKAFSDAVVNAVNRMIQSMMNSAIDDFFGKFIRGGGISLGSTTRLMSDSLATIAGNSSIFANGGAFDRAQRFANGGAFTNRIIDTPTLFRFANGAKLGEMGEAGPEAIMPLTRGSNGKLGVQAHGSGPSGELVVRLEKDGSLNAYFEGIAGRVVTATAPAMMEGSAKATNDLLARRQSRRLR